jgi:hypothetical protein
MEPIDLSARRDQASARRMADLANSIISLARAQVARHGAEEVVQAVLIASAYVALENGIDPDELVSGVARAYPGIVEVLGT